ncbi:hypothetical protein L1987_10272 [Smallanthus sonchifolius]|uniref:Uncharacterized protein n=1 Tax=Smallanthus sonchifolius TaxID=185202 RepID=A0ACB9JRU0_9ASTR|nr:hypothetical protein L1987_10272 [Smallanthus sonchifolius]
MEVLHLKSKVRKPEIAPMRDRRKRKLRVEDGLGFRLERIWKREEAEYGIERAEWSAIATHLSKRTDNEIKNYWNTHLKKRLIKMGIDPVSHKPKNNILLSNDGLLNITTNLSHMDQWESARLEAEARLVKQSKTRSMSLSTFPVNLNSNVCSMTSSIGPSSKCLDIHKEIIREECDEVWEYKNHENEREKLNDLTIPAIDNTWMTQTLQASNNNDEHIPETENIDKHTHGFTRDGIPGVENVTRIDVVGGMALQKKVASVTKGDEDFSKVLKEPLYSRIREALYSEKKLPNEVLEQKEIKIIDGVLEHKEIKIIEVLEEKEIKILDGVLEQETVKIGQPEEHCTTKKEVNDQWPISEIEEVEETGRSREKSNNDDDDNNSNGLFVDGRKEIIISPEVNQALGTLEKAISAFREFGFDHRSLSVSRFVNNVFTDLEDNKSSDPKHFVNELTTKNSQESRNTFSSHSSRHKVYEVGLAENNDINEELKNRDESSLTQKKIKKQRFCCFSFTSGRLNS